MMVSWIFGTNLADFEQMSGNINSRIFGDAATAFIDELFMNFKSRRFTSKATSHDHCSPPTSERVYHDSTRGLAILIKNSANPSGIAAVCATPRYWLYVCGNSHHVPWVRPAS